MTAVDHLLVLLLLAYPVYGTRSFRRYARRAARGETRPKPALYRETQLVEWSLFALLAGLWLVTGRDAAALGFRVPGGAGFVVASGLTVAMLAWLVFAWRTAKTMGADRRRRELRALGDLVLFLPASRREFGHFSLLSLTAGIVEETVYRGFLLWYLAPLLPTWAAVAVASALFAAAHAYQGASGVARVFVIGLVFGGLYLLSGSLWLPILLHVLGDVLQGAAACELLRRDAAANGAAGEAPAR